MKNYLKLLIAFLLTNIIYSQEIKSYTWEEKPSFTIIPEEYRNQPAVVLLDNRWIYTRVGEYSFATFVMNHFAVKINKQEKINDFNKVKAEDNGTIRKVRDFHARVIKPNGEIKIIPEDKIVETEVDKIKQIVFEGVEAGDILEYYYIIKENATGYGMEIFQKDVPVLNAKFKLEGSGVNFDVDFSKKFNQTGNVFIAKNLPPFKEEISATNFKNLVKIIHTTQTYQFFNQTNWDVYAPAHYSKPSFNYFSKTKARDFIENLKVEGLTTDQKLLKIDEQIKTNFDFIKKGEKAKKVKDLNQDNLKLTASDIFDLYGFTLKELEIPYRVVFGVNKFYAEINKIKFRGFNPHEMLYYIPETKKFLSPLDKYMPYSKFPIYEIQDTEGIEYNPKGKRNESISDFKFPTAPSSFTERNSKILMYLKPDLSTAIIEKTFKNTGYSGMMNRSYVSELKKEKDEKEMEVFLKDLVLNGIDIKILEHSFENEDYKFNYTNEPFILKAKAESKESFTEQAGNLLLVNIGKLLGKQMNLYQENERTFDLDFKYAKKYTYEIRFKIPEGYAVESFKDLNINQKMKVQDKEAASFVAQTRVENNELIVEIVEDYPTIHYPVTDYQEYRKVINAAADFYKANLILKLK